MTSTGKIITSVWQKNGKPWRYGSHSLHGFSESLQLATSQGILILTLALSPRGVAGAVVLRPEACCNARFRQLNKVYECINCRRNLKPIEMARIYGTPASTWGHEVPNRVPNSEGHDNLLAWFSQSDGLEAYLLRELFLRDLDDIILKIDSIIERNPDWWAS